MKASRNYTWEESKASVANTFSSYDVKFVVETLEKDTRPMLKHGSVIRPTMYLANMDIKTVLNVARPKHIARIMEDWIIATLLREMTGSEGQAVFECVESEVSFARCIRQGSVDATQIMAENGHAPLGKSG